jgi:hypothetical protein
MAVIVLVVLMLSGAVYTGEDSVGNVPSSV